MTSSVLDAFADCWIRGKIFDLEVSFDDKDSPFYIGHEDLRERLIEGKRLRSKVFHKVEDAAWGVVFKRLEKAPDWAFRHMREIFKDELLARAGIFDEITDEKGRSMSDLKGVKYQRSIVYIAKRPHSG